jgi:hypothetical protein
MAIRLDTRILVVAFVALAVAVAVALWGYSAHKKRELDKAALALVADTAARLRDALAIETAPPTANRAGFVKKLGEHAVSADRNLQKLKRLGSGSDLALTDAADGYVLTAREILKKQAESRRYRLLLEDSSQALRAHMRADNRTGAWVQDAVKVKERVNKDYRDYSLASGALDTLLGSFTASQLKIAPYVEPKVLIADALVGEARRRAREDARQVTAEFKNLQLAASR